MVWQQKEGEFPYNGKARLTPNFLQGIPIPIHFLYFSLMFGLNEYVRKHYHPIVCVVDAKLFSDFGTCCEICLSKAKTDSALNIFPKPPEKTNIIFILSSFSSSELSSNEPF